jgi:succinate-semialdehyde dehydrogenase/glutarate-semialdehyde dehydrogenase/succinate-semialdehyde dehydrogenase
MLLDSTATYVSCNPSTGKVVYTQPHQNRETLYQQVNHLRFHQQKWQNLDTTERAAQLSDFAKALARKRNHLAKQVNQETGRLLGETQAEIDKSIQLIDYYTSIAPHLLASKTVLTQATYSEVQFEPLGLVLAIMPWNYPIWQVLRFAIPALLSGNACLIKPATCVAQSTQELLKIAQSVQLAVLDIAWLDNTQIEEAIHSADAVAFTGSTLTGQHIASLAGRHLKKTVLELGGSNPFIVLADANVSQAAQDACLSRFRDAGQSCNAAKRLIVVPEIASTFIHAFVDNASKLVWGSTLAPLAREDLRQKLHGQVQDAIKHGAKLLLGGTLPKGRGFFYPATVIDSVNPNCRLYHEEVFGPVASILRASSLKDAIRLANDTQFGLGASIYTNNIDQGKIYAQQIQAGSVFINRYTSSDLRLPFGGIKSSGYGRELSAFGLYEFVNIKTYWQK